MVATSRLSSQDINPHPTARPPSSAAALRRRLRHRLPKAAIAFHGPPNSPLNPTQNTPSHIVVLDKGEATVASEEKGEFVELKLKGRKFNGPFYAALQEGPKM